MASRLTVIISQSAIRPSHLAEIEESLLTELMLAAGMDATLIGPLTNVQVDSTDYLCLSGFTQSVALISGLSTAEVAEQWRRLQLAGQVVPLGPAAPAGLGKLAPGPRVYHLPLELGTQPIVAQLRQLLADKAVQTVNVILPRAAKLPPEPATVPRAPQRSAEVAAPQPNRREAPLTAGPAVEAPNLSQAEWPDLDRLVDDFDSLDI